jgi:PAS domain S-box-containing protein
MDLLMRYGTQTPSSVSVLMVEDNESDRAAIESALRRSEIAFKLSVCERAEDALDMIPTNKESIDMVVVDYDLRAMSGMDFYRQLEHIENLPPFVMLTEVGSENLAVEALKAGMYDCIIKDPGQGYLKLLPLKLADVKQRKNDRKAWPELKKEVVEHQKVREQISIAYDALNSATSGIIITDSDLRIRFSNPACLRMFKYDTLSDIIGKNAINLFFAEKNKKSAETKSIVQQSKEKSQELVVQRTDGTALPVEVFISEVTDSEGTVVGKMASFIDISARKKTEAVLREISRKILDSQENERKLVAQEIHDSISGDLAAIKLSLEEKLSKMKGDPPDDTISLEKIISMIEDTIQETRRISARLRPSMLDDLGLLPTVDWFCREFEKNYPEIRVVRRFKVEEDDVADQAKVVVYRILQEAMNNVAKHSEADRVHISIVKFGNELKLKVQDNGCGFDFETISSNPSPMSGYGLSNMRDRAEICGGKLEVTSKPGAGTTIELILPCDSMPWGL